MKGSYRGQIRPHAQTVTVFCALMYYAQQVARYCACTVPDSKSRNIPEVVLVRRWAGRVLGIWREGAGWVKGGANRVSLQAT